MAKQESIFLTPVLPADCSVSRQSSYAPPVRGSHRQWRRSCALPGILLVGLEAIYRILGEVLWSQEPGIVSGRPLNPLKTLRHRF